MSRKIVTEDAGKSYRGEQVSQFLERNDAEDAVESETHQENGCERDPQTDVLFFLPLPEKKIE